MAAGQGALSQLVFFPIVLIVAFGALYAARSWMQSTAGGDTEAAC
ncbi:MAG: hypothetical protein AAFN91_04735 [Pseudomonadota bacterium]